MTRPLVFLLLLVAAFFQTACLVGPNYKRPQVNVPPAYRGPDGSAAGTAAEKSLGDEKWWSVFQDEQLQKLIRTALEQNYDLRIAATHILEAQAQLAATRADQFPTISGVAQDSGLRSPPLGGGFPTFTYNSIQLALSASWNPDFWGKYRRATEGARAELLANQWAQKAVVSSLVGSVASSYFALRELDLQLQISQRTLAARQQSLELTTKLVDGGAAPVTDERQAQELVETASAAIPDIERQIQQQENAITTLLGQNPGPITRGRALIDQPLPDTIPAGLPSALLERRPDIREAEQRLVAANAQIGVARAAFFPDISLTALGGIQSGSLTTLFRGSSRAWSYTGSATQPIFTAGRLKANLRFSEAQKQEMVLSYQQSIQQAFRDVSNSLIAYQKYRVARTHVEALTAAAKDASDLSHTRYQGGATSYLEVLTSETNYYSAELNLAAARFNERLALVQVYGALGGGWQQ
ncbi:MAG TPA: efflux transporter outer membrane subunit [Bryobacteraceae bacterium]|nr:efflux transporter outer membrane subunit [Bryobacteraceae bacterium]